jgi:hypothetical protein
MRYVKTEGLNPATGSIEEVRVPECVGSEMARAFVQSCRPKIAGPKRHKPLKSQRPLFDKTRLPDGSSS